MMLKKVLDKVLYFRQKIERKAEEGKECVDCQHVCWIQTSINEFIFFWCCLFLCVFESQKSISQCPSKRLPEKKTKFKNDLLLKSKLSNPICMPNYLKEQTLREKTSGLTARTQVHIQVSQNKNSKNVSKREFFPIKNIKSDFSFNKVVDIIVHFVTSPMHTRMGSNVTWEGKMLNL